MIVEQDDVDNDTTTRGELLTSRESGNATQHTPIPLPDDDNCSTTEESAMERRRESRRCNRHMLLLYIPSRVSSNK